MTEKALEPEMAWAAGRRGCLGCGASGRLREIRFLPPYLGLPLIVKGVADEIFRQAAPSICRMAGQSTVTTEDIWLWLNLTETRI